MTPSQSITLMFIQYTNIFKEKKKITNKYPFQNVYLTFLEKHLVEYDEKYVWD
jgi:hypothetical protein